MKRGTIAAEVKCLEGSEVTSVLRLLSVPCVWLRYCGEVLDGSDIYVSECY